jgi:hypothetical protein
MDTDCLAGHDQTAVSVADAVEGSNDRRADWAEQRPNVKCAVGEKDEEELAAADTDRIDSFQNANGRDRRRLKLNDPYVAGAVIHGAMPSLAQCSYNFIDSLQHDYRCSTDAPRRKIGFTSPEPFGSVFLLKISISALNIELDSDEEL